MAGLTTTKDGDVSIGIKKRMVEVLIFAVVMHGCDSNYRGK